MTRREKLQHAIDAQRRWIADHGGSEYGYVLRYGSGSDSTHYGEGGEMIYKADHDALLRLMGNL